MVEGFQWLGHRAMPLGGLLPVAVPGAVEAMATAVDRWGSGRFTLGQLLEPAIGYAAEGFPVAPKVATWITQAPDVIAQFPSSARVFMPQGHLPRPGEVLVMPDLARTLRAVAAAGGEEFYRGDVAHQVVSYCRDHGGLFTELELAEHRADIY